jgi:hypothetical protein
MLSALSLAKPPFCTTSSSKKEALSSIDELISKCRVVLSLRLNLLRREEIQSLSFLLSLPQGYNQRSIKALIHCDLNPSLKSLIFLNTTLASYRKTALTKPFTICIKGLVIKDGIGDYKAMQCARAILQKAYPGIEIKVVAEVQDLSRRRAAFSSDDPDIHVYGINYSGNTSDPDAGYEQYVPEDSKEAFEIAKRVVESADVVFDMPNMVHPSIIRSENTIRVFEPGTKVFRSEPGIFMGASDLSNGFLIPKPLSDDEKSFSNFESLSLRDFLLEGFSDTPSYLSDTRLDLCYMKRKELKLNYVLSLCVALKEFPQQKLDIIIDLESIRDFSSPDFSEFLSELGIQKVEFYKLAADGTYRCEDTIPYASCGKVVRIINPFPLSHRDMRIIMANSSSIGCTGDVSFSEAISEKKLINYEVRLHKEQFFHDLMQLATAPLRLSSPFFDYLKLLEQRNRRPLDLKLIEEIGSLMASSEVHAHAEIFYNFIHTHYRFNEMLIDLVKRERPLQEHPEILTCEQTLFSEFSSVQPLSEIAAKLEESFSLLN